VNTGDWKEDGWRENTTDNPFWRHQTPVEIETLKGTIKPIRCPRCSRSMMTYVLRWRPLPDETKKQPTQ